MGKHKIKEESVSPAKKKSKMEEEPSPLDTSQADLDASQVSEMTYSQKLQYSSAIASPMAGKKLTKKLLKLVKKAYSNKNHLRSGLREVQSRIRKGERGLVLLAADVTPLDVMCHMPAVCEENKIPYCYVPLRRDISDAMAVKRPTLMALVLEKGDSFSSYQDLYNECLEGVRALSQE